MKQIINIILVFIMIFTGSIAVYAQPHAEASTFTLGTIGGVSSNYDLTDLFGNAEIFVPIEHNINLSRNINQHIVNFPRLQDISFSVDNNNLVIFNAELLLDDNESYLLESVGAIYTAEGHLRNNRFVFDLESVGEYQFVQTLIRLDWTDLEARELPTIYDRNVSATLTVVLQNIFTEELFHFELNVDMQFVLTMADVANLKDDEDFVKMTMPHRNVVNPIETPYLRVKSGIIDGVLYAHAFMEGEDECIVDQSEIDAINVALELAEMGIAPMNADVPIWRWVDFFEELRFWGDTRLDWWPHIPTWIINLEWQADLNRWNPRWHQDYTVAAFVTPTGPTRRTVYMYMTRINRNMLNATHASGQKDLAYTMVLEHNTHTNWLNVIHFGGPTISNIELTLWLNSQANHRQVFNTIQTSARVQSAPSFIDTAIALAPLGGTVGAFRDLVQQSTDYRLNETRTLPTTQMLQASWWGGRAARVIYINGRTARLSRENDFIMLRGEFYEGRAHSTVFSFQYVARTW